LSVIVVPIRPRLLTVSNAVVAGNSARP